MAMPGSRGGTSRAKDLKAGEVALPRIIRLNPPGRISLAGAYALGYGALGLAQQDGDAEGWFDELDALDALFLGTVFPQRFRDSYEFANTRDAWLRLLRGTVHWKGIERFVRLTIDTSSEHELPVDGGELLLILAGKVEAAQLDQRKLPKALLPETALASSRAAAGPPADFVMPAPVGDTDIVERFWDSTQVDLSHDGTVADALRDGCHRLNSNGLDARENAVVLLPALFTALAARGSVLVDDLSERATAWALGLDEKSPLVPVTDVILTGVNFGLSSDEILARLYNMPTFAVQTGPQDCSWHSSPGEALRALAFELGYQQIVRRERRTVKIGSGALAMLHAKAEQFEAKFGRPWGPGDPVFFDPDADEPTAISVLELERISVDTLSALGISPAWIYANQHTDGLLPRLDGDFQSDTDRREWDDAIARYLRAHPGAVVDHGEEIRRLRSGFAVSSIGMAQADPGYGRSLVQRWSSGSFEEFSDADLVHALLRTMADELHDSLASDPDVMAAAQEHARAWGGAALAGEVAKAIDKDPADTGPAVLLAAFAAAGPPSDQDDDSDLDIDIAGDPGEICEEVVERILGTGDLDLPRRLIGSVLDGGQDESGPAIAILIAHAMGYLISIRSAGITANELDEAVNWVGAGHGVEYAGPAAVVASLAGHPQSEQLLRQRLKVKDVTVAHLADTLSLDFFPAMMWLCAGLVATQADGNAGWLHQHRTES